LLRRAESLYRLDARVDVFELLLKLGLLFVDGGHLRGYLLLLVQLFFRTRLRRSRAHVVEEHAHAEEHEDRCSQNPEARGGVRHLLLYHSDARSALGDGI